MPRHFKKKSKVSQLRKVQEFKARKRIVYLFNCWWAFFFWLYRRTPTTHAALLHFDAASWPWFELFEGCPGWGGGGGFFVSPFVSPSLNREDNVSPCERRGNGGKSTNFLLKKRRRQQQKQKR